MPRLDREGVVGDHQASSSSARSPTHDVSPVAPQLFCMIHAVHPHHVTEFTRMSCGDPCDRVLEDHRLIRRHVEQLRGAKKRVWRRLTRDVLVAQGHPVDADLDVMREAGDVENLTGVGARRHHRHREPGGGHRLEVAPRSLEHVDAVGVQCLLEQRRSSGCPGSSTSSSDSENVAALEEGPNAVVALLAVHVGLVVLVDVEGDERVSAVVGTRTQEGVEHLLPRLAVHACRIGEHAVEVEQACPDFFGQTQRGCHTRTNTHVGRSIDCANGRTASERRRAGPASGRLGRSRPGRLPDHRAVRIPRRGHVRPRRQAVPQLRPENEGRRRRSSAARGDRVSAGSVGGPNRAGAGAPDRRHRDRRGDAVGDGDATIEMELVATTIGRTASAKEVTALGRSIRVDGDELTYTRAHGSGRPAPPTPPDRDFAQEAGMRTPEREPLTEESEFRRTSTRSPTSAQRTTPRSTRLPSSGSGRRPGTGMPRGCTRRSSCACATTGRWC